MRNYQIITETFHSLLEVDELLNRVEESTKPVIIWGFLHGEPCKGEVCGNSFIILRRTWNRKAQPPQVVGVVEATEREAGSLLRVQSCNIEKGLTSLPAKLLAAWQ